MLPTPSTMQAEEEPGQQELQVQAKEQPCPNFALRPFLENER